MQNKINNKYLQRMNKEDSITDSDLEFEKIEDEKKAKICQFIVDGSDFWPSTKSVEELPSALYKIRKDYSKGLFLRKIDMLLNNLVKIDSSSIFQDLLSDIQKFWESRKEYEKRGRIYKRNVLLYSIPGMGKTSIINLLIDDVIKKRNGLVISLGEATDIFNFSEAITYIRNTSPKKPIITVIEDIDKYVGGSGDGSLESELLSILDGINTFDNMVIIATTNYPELLNDRFINRPSRFSRLIEYKPLNSDARKEFLEKINLKEDLENINIDEWVKKTKDFTTDMIKELCNCIFIDNMKEDEAFKAIDKMREKKVLKCNDESSKSLGFN